MSNEKTTGILRIYNEGTRVDIFCDYVTFPQKNKGGGLRGSVTTFSRASRLRLIKLLCSLRQSSIIQSKMITLTYHEKHENIKQDLKHFCQFLRRNDPLCSAIWRLELQQRGTPHYHLLYFGRGVHHSEIARSWNRIADPGNKDHLAASTEIRSCRDANTVGPYLCKYLGKLPEPIEGTTSDPIRWGRHWGVFNRAQLPKSSYTEVRIDGATASRAIERELSKYTDFSNAKKRFTKFVQSPQEGKTFVKEVINHGISEA